MESIQAVGFNAAINITTLSYFSTTQPPLINIAVSSVLATNHMTGTFTHSPWPGETGCRWSSACLHRHSPGHLRAGAETENRSEPDTVVSSRNLLYSSSVINCRGSLFRNYPGMQRQPESSLWSLTGASDLPKCQGDAFLCRVACPRSPALAGDSWAGVGVHVTGYLLTATEPSEHFINVLNKKIRKSLQH